MLANINLKVEDEVIVNGDFIATVKAFKTDTDGTILVTVIDQEDEAFDVKITDLNKNDYEDYEPLITKSKISRVIEGIDYEALREQKLRLLEVIAQREDDYERVGDDEGVVVKAQIDGLTGILNMIDAIQDAVVKDGIKTERQVFGKLN